MSDEPTIEQLRAELDAARARIAELEELVASPALPPWKEILETLLRTIPDYVYLKDRERRFVIASDQFCELFDRSLDEIVGRRDEELFPPAIAEETVADDRAVIGTGVPLIGKEEGSDEVGWVLTNKVPWRRPDGEIRA